MTKLSRSLCLAMTLAAAAATGAAANPLAPTSASSAHMLTPLAQFSCSQAKSALQERGYRNVEASDCGGLQYSFDAERSGRAYTVVFNAESGGSVDIPR